jgi:fucose 4-O-acetylase-like acetyltransferase
MSELSGLATTTTPVRQRVAYLDNAKYWVMLLVVIGHFLTRLRGIDAARGLYAWIYAFHMPFFILISGYTARRYVGDARQIKRMVSTLIIPYLIVETTMQIITHYFQGDPKHFQILSPQWLAWFIVALVIWRLTTPIWRALRYPIATSIAISLLVGLFHVPNTLAFAKVLGFLPFYVVGLHMNRERFDRLADTRIRVVAVAMLAGAFAFTQIYAGRWTTAWLLFKQNYTAQPLDVTRPEGVLIRAMLLAVAFILTFSALSLIPRRRSWTSRLGQRTIYSYLLHGYVVLALAIGVDFWGKIKPYGGWAILACVVIAIVLANLLMTRPIESLFRPLFQPNLTWMFRKTPDSSAQTTHSSEPSESPSSGDRRNSEEVPVTADSGQSGPSQRAAP